MAEKCGCKIVKDGGDTTPIGEWGRLKISYCPLHATAPLMLEACRKLLEHDLLYNERANIFEIDRVLQDAIAIARAAIAAAGKKVE